MAAMLQLHVLCSSPSASTRGACSVLAVVRQRSLSRHSGRVTTCSAQGAHVSSRSSTAHPHVTAAPPAFENIDSPVVQIVESVFKFPPLFKLAVSQARKRIVDRAKQIGVDFEGEVSALSSAVEWEEQLVRVTEPNLRMPQYYLQPFHAYDDGNLCWEAAWEVGPAAASVHAPVMDPTGKELDPQGDQKLRSGYSTVMQQLLLQLPHRPLHDVLDMGCATGLSTLELQRIFPEASITGIDLSPHFLAVAQYQQQQRLAQNTQQKQINYMHRAAEATGFEDATFALVSLSLMCHELPQSATRNIFAEAYRLLRPGGVISIMDQNPFCPAFQHMLGNPMAFAAFKSTEPWLQDYITLDVNEALTTAGFQSPLQGHNTPRHRTIVAVKP